MSMLAVPAAGQEFPDQLPPPRFSRLVIWVALLGLVVFITWASFARINQVSRAQGVVIASARTQQIQASDGGIITQLPVKEGDKVKAGQLLAMLEKQRAQAAYDDSEAKVAALRITLVRLEAELYGKPLVFDDSMKKFPEMIRGQTDLFHKRRQLISQQTASLERMASLARQELSINEPLLARGDVSQADVIRLRRQVADIEAQITNVRNKYFEEAQMQMIKAQEDLNTQSETLRDRSQVLEQTEIHAPVDGIVKNVRFTTIGGVLRPGDLLMELVPAGNDLIVEAKLNPVDIASLKEGQKAKVKLDAYDYSVFGAMEGELTYISPDTLVDENRSPGSQQMPQYYRGHIVIRGREFKNKDNEPLAIRPGMTASVEIELRSRTVLSYLTKPISKTFNQSMKDR